VVSGLFCKGARSCMVRRSGTTLGRVGCVARKDLGWDRWFCTKLDDKNMYKDRQSWVGRRIQPSDACFTVLPWGLVDQKIVKEFIVPEAIKRHFAGRNHVARILATYDLTTEDVEEGAKQSYLFLADRFSKGDAVFESDYADRINRHLGACFDLQLRQLDKEQCKVTIEEIHEATVSSAFFLYMTDPTNPEELQRSNLLFDTFGINVITGMIHFTYFMFRRLFTQIKTAEDQGIRLAIEVIIRTTERANFGPHAGETMKDCEHVLWLYGKGTNEGLDVLSSRDIEFELANINEALSMIQDTHSPELFACETP